MSLDLLLSHDIPVLKPSDTGNYALELMDEHYLKELPMVLEDDYLALINENDLLDWITPESPLSDGDFLNFKPIIAVSNHPFDALNAIHEMNLGILPVIDTENKYLGSITRTTLINYLAENSGLNAPGGIIVLEVPPRNYTLYDISRICENEDVIITNTSLRTNSEGLLEVTLKINRTIVDPIVASLERHKYIVKEVYGSRRNDDDLTDNYNLLMNYLDM